MRIRKLNLAEMIITQDREKGNSFQSKNSFVPSLLIWIRKIFSVSYRDNVDKAQHMWYTKDNNKR